MTTTDTRKGATTSTTGADSVPDVPGLSTRRTSSTTALLVRIGVLGLVLALAVYGALPLIDARNWVGLAILLVVAAFIFFVYLSRRVIPLKYLVPGTLFLIAFMIYPVVTTATTALTNFGDGHRGSKEEAIAAVEGGSFVQLPDSPVYSLTLATEGDSGAGDIAFLLVDPGTEQTLAGTADGLTELDSAEVSDGRITGADGYTVLGLDEVTARTEDITLLSVPTDGGFIRSQGLQEAYEGSPQRTYEAGCDCITDSATGQVWTADDGEGSFFDENGDNLTQGWRVNVGLRNFADVLTNPTIAGSFFKILVWNFAFAIGTVALTFAFGLLVALVLNHDKLRGQRFYRSLLILPYAMPTFAMYLVWRDMFNTDFGLINRLFGLEVNWFGTGLTAQLAILFIQLWLGYSYMFLVCTGALQAIPTDLTEAASVDGAKPFHAFRTITFPLLLVALAPLLIASFAFNFNNFSAIFFTTAGGPFPPDNPTAGATDLLITYTYRLAFGAQGAQYGFAAAISIFIFLIVAVISTISFKRTQALEEIN